MFVCCSTISCSLGNTWLLTGGGDTGDDAAALLAASWHAARRAALAAGGLQQFHFRQFLFARQARLLLQLQRPGEVWRPRALRLVTYFCTPACLLIQHVTS